MLRGLNFKKVLAFLDDWVITGNHVFKSERLDESAVRIFTGLTGLTEVYKKQFRTFGNPKRIKSSKDVLWVKSKDVNPRTMSVAYYFLLPVEKVNLNDENVKWFPIEDMPQLGFDHADIIERAYADVQQKVLGEPIIFEFLDDIDQDVKNYGGRIYLSKDARMSKETYKTTYKESSQKIYDTINQFDPKGKFVSLLSKRLGIR